MPNLPDMPGKDLVGGTRRRARAIAGAAGAGALAVGGFVAKRVLDARSRGDDGTAPGPAVAERPQPVAKPAPEPAPKPASPAGPKAEKPKPPTPKAEPKADKPKPAAPKAEPKAAKPKPAAPKAPKPKAAKPKAAKQKPPKAKAGGTPPATTGTDAPTIPGAEPGDQRGGKDPHHALNTPVGDPDPTEYPDPYDKREDPRAPADPDGAPFGEEPHPATGAESTSEPPPSQDPEVGDRAKPPRRDNLDD